MGWNIRLWILKVVISCSCSAACHRYLIRLPWLLQDWFWPDSKGAQSSQGVWIPFHRPCLTNHRTAIHTPNICSFNCFCRFESRGGDVGGPTVYSSRTKRWLRVTWASSDCTVYEKYAWSLALLSGLCPPRARSNQPAISATHLSCSSPF